jgi:hypothetical protein
VAASLLDRAAVERAVFDGPDRVMTVGHTRLFTGALRRAVEVRDRHCTHPGCTVPAERCEVDHVVPFAEGGPTNQSNATLLCPAHHRWRHRSPPAGATERAGPGQPYGGPPRSDSDAGPPDSYTLSPWLRHAGRTPSAVPLGEDDRAKVRSAVAAVAAALDEPDAA